MAPQHPRAGILTIRAWLDDDGALRVRIMMSADVRSARYETVIVGAVPPAIDCVTRFLSDVSDGAQPDSG